MIGVILVFILGLSVFIILITIISIPFRRYLPRWYVCDLMGGHGKVINTGHNGSSAIGRCTKCGKTVLQDSQGNWF